VEIATLMARMLVERLVSKEQQFFSHIGVDEYICWIGKMPPYSVPNYYFLSREDMANFGVLNVHTPDNYRETSDFHVKTGIRYLSLKDE
jgi:hypothetical protein